MTKTMKWMLAMVAMLGAACGGSQALSPTRLAQLQVSPPTASVPAGVDQQLSAVAIFENGHREDVSAQVAWSISDEAIARVDASGLVSTSAPGTTRVSASLQGLSASANLVVSNATLVSLALVPELVRIPLGATLTATVTGNYTDGSVVDLTSQAAWSAPTGGLTMLTAGQSRATAKGPVRLCVRFQSMQANVDLEVTDAAAVALHVASSRDLAALPKGAISILSVTADFTDATVLDVSGDVTWQSDDQLVAEVVASRVRAVQHGSARLVASYQGRSIPVDVTVSSAEVVGLTVYPPLATAPIGDFTALEAIATYSDGSSGNVTELVTWSSLDPAAVQVFNVKNEIGHAFGWKRGTQSVVTAQLEGMSLSATALVQVGAPSVKSIAIDQALDPRMTTLSVSHVVLLSATAVLSDDGFDTDAEADEEDDEHHDFTSKLLWESWSPNVARADPDVPGLILAVGPGQATIVATMPGTSFRMQVTVFVID
jgi:hypothetical protein